MLLSFNFKWNILNYKKISSVCLDMHWKPQDVCEMALPIVTIWKYTGLSAFKLTGEVHSRDRKFISRSSNISYIAICVALANLVVYIKIVGVSNTLKSYIFLTQMVSITVQNIGMILMSQKKRNEIAFLFSKILTIDDLIFDKIGNRPVYLNTFKYFLKIVAPKYLIVLSGCIFNIVIVYSDDRTSKISSLCVYSGWFFDLNLELLLVLLLIVLQELYKEFNDGVRKNTKATLKDVKQIYFLLHDLWADLNKTMQGFVFCKLIPDFIFAVTGLYYLVTKYIDGLDLSSDFVSDIIAASLSIPSVIISNVCFTHFLENITMHVCKAFKNIWKNKLSVTILGKNHH
jgi:hypothetical protein